jgi:hypothetical protein
MKPLQPNETTAFHALIRKSIELEQAATHHKTKTAERNQAIIDALEEGATLRKTAQYAAVSYQYVDRIRRLILIRQPQATRPTSDPTNPAPDNNDAMAA